MKMPRLLRGRRRRLLARLAINGTAQAVAVVAITHAIRAALDAPADAAAIGAAGQAALVGVAAAAIVAALRWRERIDAEALAQSYVFRVRTRLLAKLGEIEPATLAARGHGGLLLRFAGDLTAIAQWIGRGIARLVVSGIVIGAALVAIAAFHWSLAATLGAGLAIAAAAACWRAPRLDDALVALRTARARLVTRVNATLNRLPELEATGNIAGEAARLGRRARNVRESAVARAREIAMIDAIAEAGALAIPIAVLCTALATRGAGTVTDGELIAVLGVALLVAGPVRELGRSFDYWRRARLARLKIEQFLRLPKRRASVAPVAAGASP
jgi:ABC-type multidrug transport system fused ATPase/permease subunit